MQPPSAIWFCLFPGSSSISKKSWERRAQTRGPGNEVEISRGLRCHFVYEVRSFGVYISIDELIYRSKTLTNWTLEKAATYGRHMEMHCSGELEVVFLTNHSVLIDPNCALNDT